MNITHICAYFVHFYAHGIEPGILNLHTMHIYPFSRLIV